MNEDCRDLGERKIIEQNEEQRGVRGKGRRGSSRKGIVGQSCMDKFMVQEKK